MPIRTLSLAQPEEEKTRTVGVSFAAPEPVTPEEPSRFDAAVDRVRPFVDEALDYVKATGDTAWAVGQGMVIWPFAKAYGGLHLLAGLGGEAAREAEARMMSIASQPKTEKGYASAELLGKGIETLLKPATMAGKAAEEKFGPGAGYAVESAGEILTFGLMGGAKGGVRRVAAKVRKPRVGEPGYKTVKGGAEKIRKIEIGERLEVPKPKVLVELSKAEKQVKEGVRQEQAVLKEQKELEMEIAKRKKDALIKQKDIEFEGAKVRLKKQAEEKKAKYEAQAQQASNIRTWVAHRGGLSINDIGWRGEIKGLTESGNFPPGFRNRKGMMMDEAHARAVEEGWLPRNSTVRDFFEALESNMKSEKGMEKHLDQLQKKHYADLTGEEPFTPKEAPGVPKKAEVKPTAEFLGYMDNVPGEGPLPLFNIPLSSGGKTTVSLRGLKESGFKPPKYPKAPEAIKEYSELKTKSNLHILKSEKGQIEVNLEPLARAAKTAGKDVKEIGADAKRLADDYLGAVSTRLENIHPSLKQSLRRFELRSGLRRVKASEEILPFLKKTKEMTKADAAIFDLARKNADAKTLQRMVIKYNMDKEYGQARRVLDNIYRDANEVGLDVKYRRHYHPRVLKDTKGFLEYFYKQDDWPILEKAIREKEVSLNRYLNADEKAQLINTMLRGYRSGEISLAKPGQLKKRTVETITPEIDKFYLDSNAALVRYVNDIAEAIEGRKAFGRKAKKAKREPGDMNDTIGGYVLKLLEEKKITPSQEQVLKELLQGRFNEVGTRGIIGLYKNISYVDTMGSQISAVTQFGDLAWSVYKTGYYQTGKAATKALFGKSRFKKEDIGIKHIATEFASPKKAAKAVSEIFRAVGLTKIDNIGKEALINSTYNVLKKQLRTKKGEETFRKEVEPYFESETKALIGDIKADRITENVKLHLLNTMADFQPIILSEMPLKYLLGGNGRIFYMLKTFTIKQFDVYRREIFRKIANKGTRLQGLKNLIRLGSAFVVCNASADVIKDLILGRPIILEDKVVDNLLRLFGISKFVTWKARTEGVGSALVRQIAPPFKAADAITKDIAKAGDEKGLETTASIPIVGKLYYWWFGKGKSKIEAREKRRRGKKQKPRGITGLRK